MAFFFLNKNDFFFTSSWGDDSICKYFCAKMRTRIQIPGTHVNVRLAWQVAYDPSAQNTEAGDYWSKLAADQLSQWTLDSSERQYLNMHSGETPGIKAYADMWTCTSTHSHMNTHVHTSHIHTKNKNNFPRALTHLTHTHFSK